MRASLKIIFVGEPGVDEGGLLTEMFSIFFESVFSGEGDLFVGSGDAVDAGKSALGGNNEGSMIVRSDVVLPSATDTSPQRMLRLRAFGRAMVKALYEGRRMGNRLCPSVFKFLTGTTPSMRDLQMFDPQTARSLQWTLATAGVEEFGMHFESVGEPEKGHVTDSNKAAFVRAKIDWILVKSRQPHLLAIKAGQCLFLPICSISSFFFSFLFLFFLQSYSVTVFFSLFCVITSLSFPYSLSFPFSLADALIIFLPFSFPPFVITFHTALLSLPLTSPIFPYTLLLYHAQDSPKLCTPSHSKLLPSFHCSPTWTGASCCAVTQP